MIGVDRIPDLQVDGAAGAADSATFEDEKPG